MLNLGINIQLNFFFNECLKTPYSWHLEYKTLNSDLILEMDRIRETPSIIILLKLETSMSNLLNLNFKKNPQN